MISSSNGNAEAFAGVQLEIVDAAFQRHDPAVEQVGGADELAAEVVDDEAAAQRLHVQRRLVEVAVRVVAQVEHVEREFAAGDDERTPAGNPAGVVFFAPDDGES